MIYIVTGDGPRCGSSMFMNALKAGGMDLAYDMRCDWLEMEVGGTRLTPEGESLYELPLGDCVGPDFPDPAKFNEKALKLWAPPWGTLTHIRPGAYTVFWLHRAPQARWKSFDKQHEGTNVHLHEGEKYMRDLAIQNAFKICVWRQDMKVIELNFDVVIDRPVETFRRLVHLGIPINPDHSGAIPKKDKRHFRG